MSCNYSFYLSEWTFWCLVGLALSIEIILAINLRKQTKLEVPRVIKSILIMLMISDAACLLWIRVNSGNGGRVCNESVNNVVLVVLVCSGAVFISLNQISYWLLTCTYWDLSY